MQGRTLAEKMSDIAIIEERTGNQFRGELSSLKREVQRMEKERDAAHEKAKNIASELEQHRHAHSEEASVKQHEIIRIQSKVCVLHLWCCEYW